MAAYVYAALLFIPLAAAVAATVAFSIACVAAWAVVKAWWATTRLCVSTVMATTRQWAEVRSAKAALGALSRTAIADPGAPPADARVIFQVFSIVSRALPGSQSRAALAATCVAGRDGVLSQCKEVQTTFSYSLHGLGQRAALLLRARQHGLLGEAPVTLVLKGIEGVTHDQAQQVAAAVPGITKLVLQTCSIPFEQLAFLLEVAPIRAVNISGAGGRVLDHSGGGVYGRLLSHHSLQTLILSHASRQVAAPTVIAGSPLQPPTSIHLRTLQLPWLVMEFLGGATLLNHLLSAPNLRHLQVCTIRYMPPHMAHGSTPSPPCMLEQLQVMKLLDTSAVHFLSPAAIAALAGSFTLLLMIPLLLDRRWIGFPAWHHKLGAAEELRQGPSTTLVTSGSGSPHGMASSETCSMRQQCRLLLANKFSLRHLTPSEFEQHVTQAWHQAGPWLGSSLTHLCLERVWVDARQRDLGGASQARLTTLLAGSFPVLHTLHLEDCVLYSPQLQPLLDNMPALQTITFSPGNRHMADTTVFNMLLSLLTVPSLTALTVELSSRHKPPPGDPYPRVPSCLTPPFSPRLSTLNITQRCLRHDLWGPILRQLPGLTHLSIISTEISQSLSNDIYDESSFGKEQQMRCPFPPLLQLRSFSMPALAMSTQCALQLLESPFLRHVQVRSIMADCVPGPHALRSVAGRACSRYLQQVEVEIIDLHTAVALPAAAVAAIAGPFKLVATLRKAGCSFSPSLAQLAATRLAINRKVTWCTLVLRLQSREVVYSSRQHLQALGSGGFHKLEVQMDDKAAGPLGREHLRTIGAALGHHITSITFGPGSFTEDLWHYIMMYLPRVRVITILDSSSTSQDTALLSHRSFMAFCLSLQHPCELQLPLRWRDMSVVPSDRVLDNYKVSVMWQP